MNTLPAEYQAAIKQMAEQSEVNEKQLVKMAIRFYQYNMAHVQLGACVVRWFDAKGKEVRLMPPKKAPRVHRKV